MNKKSFMEEFSALVRRQPAPAQVLNKSDQHIHLFSFGDNAGDFNVISLYDFKRVRDGHLLNDAIVNFWLAYWLKQHQERIPVFQARFGRQPSVNVFSTYFLSKLRKELNDPNVRIPAVLRERNVTCLSPHHRLLIAYQSAFTNGIELLRCPYLLIPVVERGHMSLVVCFISQLLQDNGEGSPSPREQFACFFAFDSLDEMTVPELYGDCGTDQGTTITTTSAAAARVAHSKRDIVKTVRKLFNVWAFFDSCGKQHPKWQRRREYWEQRDLARKRHQPLSQPSPTFQPSAVDDGPSVARFLDGNGSVEVGGEEEEEEDEVVQVQPAHTEPLMLVPNMYDVDIPNLFNKSSAPISVVKVPQQRDGTNCGIFMLRFAEHFLNLAISTFPDGKCTVNQFVQALEGHFELLKTIHPITYPSAKRQQICGIIREMAGRNNTGHLLSG